MTAGVRRIFLFIIVITLLAVVIDLPRLPFNVPLKDKFPLKLGLDLQGGTEITLATDMSKVPASEKDAALQSVRQVLEKRVNLFGVSEALVQTSRVGDERRILVSLPGIKDASAAASLIGKTAKLDFRELPATASAAASPSATENLFIPTGLTGADLKSNAKATYGSSSQGGKSGPEVQIEFTAEGAKKFAEITKRNVGRPLGIFLDDVLQEAPTVQQEIVGGNAVITQTNIDEAKNLADLLNAGALKVPVHIIDQHTVGPSLGQESVNNSLIAGTVGLLILMIYMAAYYGSLGLIADLALLIYTALMLAIFKTGLFLIPPVTLSLAGIAGFILSVGMAVDANILIFERMKEELRWGKSKTQALELGFDRAWSSIWASNVSSLITAVILYYFGSSLIRGFAIVLAIGVLVSMFSAITVTRTFLRLLVR